MNVQNVFPLFLVLAFSLVFVADSSAAVDGGRGEGGGNTNSNEMRMIFSMHNDNYEEGLEINRELEGDTMVPSNPPSVMASDVPTMTPIIAADVSSTPTIVTDVPTMTPIIATDESPAPTIATDESPTPTIADVSPAPSVTPKLRPTKPSYPTHTKSPVTSSSEDIYDGYIAESTVESYIAHAIGWMAVLGVVGMIYTAYCIDSYPDGICASFCRLMVSMAACICKVVCFPCRMMCGSGDRDDSRVSNPDYRSDYYSRRGGNIQMT